ncbi:redoxin domain-containing protein [Pedobacter psychrodurus]|uniref:Redoxin domain-containing protein n=1 Tax=Pedobacter psychrodurus TaxID=2530456 RepID=A0A4R0Q302_9SPHI|nr:redoxin domain-containing protein [Pedobacter psychrodurus]TCD26767.1 redoxin domain-containing protein [Pedobacter psychrodurus]
MKLITSIVWLLFFSLTQVFSQARLPNKLLWEQIKNSNLVNVKNKKTLIETKKNTAFVFLSPECPLCKNYTPVLNALAKQYPEVKIIGIVPGKSYTIDEINLFAKSYDALFDIYLDKNKSLTNTLKAKVTPEVILVDQKGNIRYRGLIDNWQAKLGVKRKVITEHYLDDAIKDINISNYKFTQTIPVGCLINDL